MSSFSTVKYASEEALDRFLTNVDAWQAIFEMLEVKDRIRLEMTNKRLGILMFEYWKRVTSFDIKLREMSDNPSKKKSCKNRWAVSVPICVNRIGDGLRSLTIRERSTYSVSCWTDNLASIGEGCPNVETINFIFDDDDMHWSRTLDIRFDSFSRLKTLIFSSPGLDPFSRSQMLTLSTRGRGFAEAAASVFLSIPTSIEVICGLESKLEEPFENAAQLEGFFADRPSLREVCLDHLRTRDRSKADIFRVIAERCPYLKSINLSGSCDDSIDYSGVVALESMKELRLLGVYFDDMEIVTICERSPLVEALELHLRFSSNIHLQSTALNALSALTKLRELTFSIHPADVSLVTEFVRELARNSGASLRRLHLPCEMHLSTAAIEALANGCAKLRYVRFNVRVGEATPASIRFLIDCIVAHPSWIEQTGERSLLIEIYVMRDMGDEVQAGLAALKALADPAANLPVGVKLHIY